MNKRNLFLLCLIVFVFSLMPIALSQDLPSGSPDGDGWLLLPREQAQRYISQGFVAVGWDASGRVTKVRFYKERLSTATEDDGTVWYGMRFGPEKSLKDTLPQGVGSGGITGTTFHNLAGHWQATNAQGLLAAGEHRITQIEMKLFLEYPHPPTVWEKIAWIQSDNVTIVDTNGIVGTISNNGNRIDWYDGSFWVRTNGKELRLPNLDGKWNASWVGKFSNKSGYTITQDGDNLILEYKESNWKVGAKIQPDNITIHANDGAVGTIKNNGNRIEWSNGSFWEK